jgi:hypothetical protein
MCSLFNIQIRGYFKTKISGFIALEVYSAKEDADSTDVGVK